MDELNQTNINGFVVFPERGIKILRFRKIRNGLFAFAAFPIIEMRIHADAHDRFQLID